MCVKFPMLAREYKIFLIAIASLFNSGSQCCLFQIFRRKKFNLFKSSKVHFFLVFCFEMFGSFLFV